MHPRAKWPFTNFEPSKADRKWFKNEQKVIFLRGCKLPYLTLGRKKGRVCFLSSFRWERWKPRGWENMLMSLHCFQLVTWKSLLSTVLTLWQTTHGIVCVLIFESVCSTGKAWSSFNSANANSRQSRQLLIPREWTNLQRGKNVANFKWWMRHVHEA